MGDVAIAHRSVILECFACVGLVPTSIVHRFVWGTYALLLFQRKEGEPNICMSGTPTSRKVASELWEKFKETLARADNETKVAKNWPWYRYRDQMSTQRCLLRPHQQLECRIGLSRSHIEDHITAWCRRGPCWCAPAMLSIVQSAFILLVMNTHSSDDRGPIT